MSEVSKNEVMGRIFGLDLLRVVAEFLIVIGHYMVWVGFARGIPHHDLFLIPAAVGLEAFFVMSGYLIGNILLGISERGISFSRWRTFVIRRLLRVYPPYFAWFILLLTVSSPESVGDAHPFEYLLFIQNFIAPMPQSDWFSVSWSLSVEFWFYIFFSICSLVAYKIKGRPAFLAITFLFILLPMALRALVSHELNWDVQIRKVVVYQLDGIAYGVLAAYLLRRWPALFQYRIPLAWTGGGLVLLTAVWWLYSEGKFNVDSYVNKIMLLSGLLIGISFIFPYLIRLDCNNQKIKRIMAWFSDSSYAVYLVHLTVCEWFVFILLKSPSAFMFLSVFTSLAISAVSLHLIERPILARRPR